MSDTGELACSFSVPGPPVPKARPRVFWDVRYHRYRAVSTHQTSEAERRIAEHFWVRYPRLKPLKCRLKIVLRFYVPHYRRVDADNLEKKVKDALNGHAYVDDSQIDETHVSVARGQTDPRTEVEIWVLPTAPLSAEPSSPSSLPRARPHKPGK